MSHKNSEMKKYLYIVLATALGVLIGTLISCLIETWVINHAITNGRIPAEYSLMNGRSSYLSPIVPVIILVATAVLGFTLGQSGWRLVYVKKKHWWRKR